MTHGWKFWLGYFGFVSLAIVLTILIAGQGVNFFIASWLAIGITIAVIMIYGYVKLAILYGSGVVLEFIVWQLRGSK